MGILFEVLRIVRGTFNINNSVKIRSTKKIKYDKNVYFNILNETDWTEVLNQTDVNIALLNLKKM